MSRECRSNRNPVFESWRANDLSIALNPRSRFWSREGAQRVAFPVELCGIIGTPGVHSNLPTDALMRSTGGSHCTNQRRQAPAALIQR